MAEMTPEQIAELDRLDEAATPGTWVAAGKQVRQAEANAGVCNCLGAPNPNYKAMDDLGKANAALIVALRNSWPAIKADLELIPTLQEQHERLGETLEVQRSEYEERLRVTSERLAKLEEAAKPFAYLPYTDSLRWFAIAVGMLALLLILGAL